MAALAIPIAKPEQSLSESTVILQVKFGLLGDSRKVSNSQVEVDTDKQLLRVAKKILVSNEFEAIRQIDRKVKKYLDSICVPFETGTRFLAVPLIDEVDRKLHEFESERAELVDRFLDSYPTLCESMSERLRVLHSPTDYPPVDLVKARFYFTWRYVAYGVPGQLKMISGRIWEEERDKAAQRFAEAQTEAQVCSGNRWRAWSITWWTGWKRPRTESRRSSRSRPWQICATSSQHLISGISRTTLS